MTVPEDYISAARELNEAQMRIYRRVRADGTSHRLAMVLALRKPPRANRRDERWRCTDESKSFRRAVPAGKYQAGLARYPGDPEAFVSSMSEARRVAERRGLQISDEPTNARTARQSEPDDDSVCELGNNLGAA